MMRKNVCAQKAANFPHMMVSAEEGQSCWPQGGIASQDASGYPATKLGLSTSTFPFCEVSCW
jgi:hypothetical protein